MGTTWTPERKAKFSATMKAKREKKEARAKRPKKGKTLRYKQLPVQDAIIYLRHARDEVYESMRAGTLATPDHAHLLAMLALEVLEPRR